MITAAIIGTWVTANGAANAGKWVVLKGTTPTVVCAVKSREEALAYAGAQLADFGGANAMVLLYLPVGLS